VNSRFELHRNPARTWCLAQKTSGETHTAGEQRLPQSWEEAALLTEGCELLTSHGTRTPSQEEEPLLLGWERGCRTQQIGTQKIISVADNAIKITKDNTRCVAGVPGETSFPSAGVLGEVWGH
jgi:hypothetical protein